MALTKCKECGAPVSTEAKACPSCGAAPPKTTSRLTWAVGGFFTLVVLMGVAQSVNRAQAPAVVVSPEEARRATVQATNQTAAIAGARVLKAAMKDPDSFQLKELVVKDDGSACYTYRAKNSFNAALQSAAVLVPGKQPQMLLESKDGNRFVTAWNGRCTKAGGEDIVAYAVRMIE